MPTHAQKILTLFQSHKTEDQNQALELLRTLGPIQPMLCAKFFSDLSNPFSTCKVRSSIATPQFIFDLLDWMLQARDPELDKKLLQIQDIRLSDGIVLHRSLSRLVNTTFSLQYVSSQQAAGWLKNAPKLTLYTVEIPYSESHLNLLTKWLCKRLHIIDPAVGRIEIHLNGSGSSINKQFPSPKNSYSRVQHTYSHIEGVLKQFLSGTFDKVSMLALTAVAHKLSLKHILNTYSNLNHLQCQELNPTLDWSTVHPIENIYWQQYNKVILSSDIESPLSHRVVSVVCDSIQDFPWIDFPSLERVIFDVGWRLSDHLNSIPVKASSELLVATMNDGVDPNEIFTYFPFDRTIIIGTQVLSILLEEVDWSIVSPVRQLHWMEEDFGRIIRQEVHFDGNVTLPLNERVTTVKVDEFYLNELNRFPNMNRLHVFNCHTEIEDVQSRFPNVSVTVSNRNLEIGLLNIRNPFKIQSDLRRRNAVKSLARIESGSMSEVWSEWLNSDDDGLLLRYQKYTYTDPTFVKSSHLTRAQWFIQHIQTYTFVPSKHRDVLFALILDSIHHQTTTGIDFVSVGCLKSLLSCYHQNVVGTLKIAHVGTTNIARMLKAHDTLPMYDQLLGMIFEWFGTSQIITWIQQVSTPIQEMFVVWYCNKYMVEQQAVKSTTQPRKWFEIIQDDQSFRMLVWRHSQQDLGLNPSFVLRYAVDTPSSWDSVYTWLGLQSTPPVFTDAMTKESISFLRWLLDRHMYCLQLDAKRTIHILGYVADHPDELTLLLKWWQQSSFVTPKLTSSNGHTSMLSIVQWMFTQGVLIPIDAHGLMTGEQYWFDKVIWELSAEYLQEIFYTQTVQIGIQKSDTYKTCQSRGELVSRILALFKLGVFVDTSLKWLPFWLERAKQYDNVRAYLIKWFEVHQTQKCTFDHAGLQNWSLSDLTNALSMLPVDIEHLEVVNFPFKQLPPNLGRFVHLKRLMLYGLNITELPTSLSTMTELEIISVSFTKLTELPEILKSLPNLKKVHARGLSLSDVDNNWLWKLHIGYFD